MTFNFCPLCASPMNPYEDDGFEREKCSKCGWVHYHNSRPTASAIIVQDGKVLLYKRAKDPFKGKWDLPGGYLEEKESPEEALRREMKEELGVEIEIKNFIGVIGPCYYPFGGQEQWNTDIYYEVTTIDPPASASPQAMRAGEPRAMDGSDVEAIDWFNPDRLPDMAFDTNVKAIEVWKKNRD